MFNLISSQITNTKKKKEFDLPFHSTESKREEILKEKLISNQTYRPNTGTSLINTYKDTFDLIQAKNRVELEFYKNSKLWSPKFKPFHFKYIFFLPMAMGSLFAYYSLNYNMTKKMMTLKKRLGGFYPNYEAKKMFRLWTQEKYVDEIYGDIFQKKEMEVYEKRYQALETKEIEIMRVNKQYRKLLSHKFQQIAFNKKLTQVG